MLGSLRSKLGWSTALSWAAEKGHEQVVEMLLGNQEVNPEKPNDHGWTPLKCRLARA